MAIPIKSVSAFHWQKAIRKGADRNRHECKLVHLIDLIFNPILTNGYRLVSELEPDLLKIQEDILRADHLVFVYPNWWATFPALLKGFIDRVFLPGFAFVDCRLSYRFFIDLSEYKVVKNNYQ